MEALKHQTLPTAENSSARSRCWSLNVLASLLVNWY